MAPLSPGKRSSEPLAESAFSPQHRQEGRGEERSYWPQRSGQPEGEAFLPPCQGPLCSLVLPGQLLTGPHCHNQARKPARTQGPTKVPRATASQAWPGHIAQSPPSQAPACLLREQAHLPPTRLGWAGSPRPPVPSCSHAHPDSSFPSSAQLSHHRSSRVTYPPLTSL